LPELKKGIKSMTYPLSKGVVSRLSNKGYKIDSSDGVKLESSFHTS